MNYIHYRYSLWKLQNSRNSTTNSFQKDIKNAKNNNKSRDEISGIRSQAWFETDCIDEEIDDLNTRYWTDLARRYCLPIPAIDREANKWTEGKYNGKRCLTKEAVLELRTLVRKEREVYLIWIAAFTGVLGALTGLIAIIKS
ncbi:MAG: hypothetical protein P9L94_12025 [Candidatus Hinthialibacter antarcticus]|nr:hypothetical protein [Candidatus Hinthialibacter antarcticus]